MYGFTTTLTGITFDHAFAKTIAEFRRQRRRNGQRQGRCPYAAFAFANSSNAATALAAYINDGPPPM